MAPALLHSLLLPLTVLLPLVLFAALWWRWTEGPALRLAPYAALPGLLLAVLPGEDASFVVPWLLLGGHLGLDALGRVFLFLIALLWLGAGIHARGYLAQDARKRRFFAFFLLAMSGNLGLPLALDLLDFYFFFALMSFSAYGLVVHEGSSFALRAGRVYLYLVMLGEVLLFVALVLIAWESDSLLLADAGAALARSPAPDLILLLLVAGFGIKAGLVPLHVWLPLAHPAAPVPASAVLSGAMIKAGLLGLLRLLPLGLVAWPDWAQVLVLAGLVMAFFGVLVGLTQTQPKTVLAYSSISQMGFPMLGLGLGLGQPAAWPLLGSAVALYALHHGLAKGALFLGVAMADGLRDRGPRQALTLAGLLLPALALAGAPLTSGALAKSALKPFAAGAPGFWPGWLPWLLSLAAVGTTLLMARFLYVLWPRGGAAHPPRAAMWGGWSLVLGALILCGAGLLPVMGPGAAPDDAKLWGLLWPLGAGILLAALMMRRFPWRERAEPLVPPGDLLVPLEALVVPITRWLARPWPLLAGNSPRLRPPPGFWWHNLALLLSLREAEAALRRLPVAGLAFVAILLLLLVL